MGHTQALAQGLGAPKAPEFSSAAPLPLKGSPLYGPKLNPARIKSPTLKPSAAHPHTHYLGNKPHGPPLGQTSTTLRLGKPTAQLLHLPTHRRARKPPPPVHAHIRPQTTPAQFSSDSAHPRLYR